MFDPLYIVYCFLAIGLLWLAVRHLSSPRYPYISKPILSRAELNFFHAIADLVPPPYILSFKPRLGDIIDVEAFVQQNDPDWKGRFGAPVWSKHIDFVIIDSETAQVMVCIELDDRSHLRPENRERDTFKNKALNAADIPLVRIKCQRSYNKEAIRNQIAPYFEV